MNPVARDKAKALLYNAVLLVIQEIEKETDLYSGPPEDMRFTDFVDLGFLIKRSEGQDSHNKDLYYIGIRVGAPGSYPHDALELLKVGANLYMRANGKTAILMSFTAAGAEKFNPKLLYIVLERAIYENPDLLAAIDALDKGEKRESRKASK